MTQENLAAQVGTTAAVISLLENGQRGLSACWLHRLAPVLKTSPGFLLDHHPDGLTTEMMDLWSNIPEQNLPKAIEVLRALSDESTGS